jgi:hypothetical protein
MAVKDMMTVLQVLGCTSFTLLRSCTATHSRNLLDLLYINYSVRRTFSRNRYGLWFPRKDKWEHLIALVS